MAELMNPKSMMEKPMAQMSSASLQQKWKYGSYNVSIASEERKVSMQLAFNTFAVLLIQISDETETLQKFSPMKDTSYKVLPTL